MESRDRHSATGQVIEIELDAVTPAEVSAFAKAVRSPLTQQFALTFATKFRQAEYEWLERIKVDMRYLLHGAQEYEYLSDLKENVPLVLRTKVIELKERKSAAAHMQFIRLETEIKQHEEVAVIARTTFVVKKPAPKDSGAV